MIAPHRLLFFITILTAIGLYFAIPDQVTLPLANTPVAQDYTLTKRAIDITVLGRRFIYNPQLNFGLDLQGGTHLVLEADMSQIPPDDRSVALDSAQEIIRRRVDGFGVSEALVQTSINEEANQYRLIVELPGVDDVEQAVGLIGQTAQLEFRELNQEQLESEATASAFSYLSAFQATELTGQQLVRAQVEFNPETGEPVVALSFDDQGAELFADITERNIGQPLGIFIDEFPASLPIVPERIEGGQASIQGEFTLETARDLATVLNAGALPAPIEIVAQRSVGASLGQASVQRSFWAGLVGLSMVLLFMVLYYRTLGFLADLALLIYAIITLALYKILGITLTLPGLAGFILSVGMAVDANILIFERYKEEIRRGKPWRSAIELGFGRAWDSIKDANIATLIICFILYNPVNWNFLNSSGLVRGFAVTLALGIGISLFTGVVVTRTLIRLFYVGKDTVEASR